MQLRFVQLSTYGNRLVDLLCSVQITFHGFMVKARRSGRRQWLILLSAAFRWCTSGFNVVGGLRVPVPPRPPRLGRLEKGLLRTFDHREGLPERRWPHPAESHRIDRLLRYP